MSAEHRRNMIDSAGSLTIQATAKMITAIANRAFDAAFFLRAIFVIKAFPNVLVDSLRNAANDILFIPDKLHARIKPPVRRN